ncbi:MAG TPA: TonB-dependent siderophore receptor [Steroidobacteraceae bacterium]|nr:TonB-dependent siderophore receptor [Steroidobacteraceae bacterium]
MTRIGSVLFTLIPLALAGVAQAADSDSSSANTTEEVVIQTSRDKGDYRVQTLDSVGPTGSTPIVNTPYSISVLPSDLIENTQAVNFKEVSKYMPLVSFQEQQGPDILRPMTRGYQGSNFENTKIDGMTIFMTGVTSMEQFDQIEVVSGASSSLYGPVPPSGVFNMVTKRPTDYDLREFTADYASDSIGTAKADLGGKLDSRGIVSYRLNAVYGDGQGYVADSHERRSLIDLGVDVRPWEQTTLELNYSSNTLLTEGFQGWFTYADSPTKSGKYILLPPAPDPQREGLGQPYAGVYLRTDMLEARIKQDFGGNWHLVAGVLNETVERNINTAVNNLTSNAGAYNTNFGSGFAPRFAITSDVAYLNGDFETFGIDHDFTLGSAGYRASSYSPITAANTACPPSATSTCLGSASIADPVIFPEPLQGPPNVSMSHIYDSSDQYQQGVNINDTLKFTDQWMLRLGASQDWFRTNSFNNKSVQTGQFSSHGISPSASIIFKPTGNSTLYATYVSSLQADADTAPASTTTVTVVNAGAALAPYRSKEYEVGYKIDFDKIYFTAALFDMDRPFANTFPVNGNPNRVVYEIFGDQINKGLELSAVGQVINGLTMYGGLTLLNSRMENTPLAATDNQPYVGTPKIKGNVLLEYHIPTLPGLVATFDYQFSGPRPGDDTDQFSVAGYNLFDLGARYTLKMWGTPVAWRLAVENITDRHYWSTIGPSNITGANTGNLVAHLGAPRTLDASVTVKF